MAKETVTREFKRLVADSLSGILDMLETASPDTELEVLAQGIATRAIGSVLHDLVRFDELLENVIRDRDDLSSDVIYDEEEKTGLPSDR